MAIFAHIPFLPFLDVPAPLPDEDTLRQLATIVPVLVAASISEKITPLLPSHVETYIFDDLADGQAEEQLVGLLDRGAGKVFTHRQAQLISMGVPVSRIVPRLAASDPLPSTPCMLEAFPPIEHTQKTRDHPVFLLGPPQPDTVNLSEIVAMHNQVPLIRAADLIKLGPHALVGLFLDGLKTDRADGLFATSVVSLAPSSTLLGQVYSSRESIEVMVRTGQATYFSRSRNELWVKGATSGATQQCVRIRTDCDGDALEVTVVQSPGTGFCHTAEISCFGPLGGLSQLQSTLLQRRQNAPQGSYTHRLFNDEKLLKAKIMEEADELCHAESAQDVADEMADLVYFALARCVAKGVSLRDIEATLDRRALKVSRRKGDAKPHWAAKIAGAPSPPPPQAPPAGQPGELCCQVIDLADVPEADRAALLKRPMTDGRTMTGLVRPIVEMVKTRGDAGLLDAVSKYDRCGFACASELTLRAPFADRSGELSAETKQAIDVAYENIFMFHAKQLEKEKEPMVVETMPGVLCSRFARPIDRVGLYVPGGTAILPSTALMLAVPAQVAGCPWISLATPARADGTISAEIVYIATKCGVSEIVKAGGAHGIAAMAYGTPTVAKVDKIFGPGNQFVTAAKMMVAGDLQAATAIDMPAGPSEVLVIADSSCVPSFVAADLLSQAEHGPDSQVVLLAVGLPAPLLAEIEQQIVLQAQTLSRLEIIRQSIRKSFILKVPTLPKALDISNQYAPEHLILHVTNPADVVPLVRNAGSVFVGPFSPESCGDYASGTNHSLPTVGFAKQYSGVSTLSFMKHITAQTLSEQGLRNIGPTVVTLATVEGLDGHANAVNVRLRVSPSGPTDAA
ncbi:hypothetical protein PtB15_2B329 [Puccinia triticina]|nr:hypothetical protein PtB15_2B329 [Puccinia triticina]